MGPLFVWKPGRRYLRGWSMSPCAKGGCLPAKTHLNKHKEEESPKRVIASRIRLDAAGWKSYNTGTDFGIFEE